MFFVKCARSEVCNSFVREASRLPSCFQGFGLLPVVAEKGPFGLRLHFTADHHGSARACPSLVPGPLPIGTCRETECSLVGAGREGVADGKPVVGRPSPAVDPKSEEVLEKDLACTRRHPF